jgi:hypothetical protein
MDGCQVTITAEGWNYALSYTFMVKLTTLEYLHNEAGQI